MEGSSERDNEPSGLAAQLEASPEGLSCMDLFIYLVVNRSVKQSLRPWGSVAMTTQHPLSAKIGTNFADKRRPLGIVRSRTKATEFSGFFS
jgi:hypothetical protein